MTQRHERQHAAEMAIGKLLAIGSLRELWTVEQLDEPSPMTKTMSGDIQRMARRIGKTPVGYRNLAREYMANHEREWNDILRQSLEAENLDHLPTGPQIIAAVAGSSAAHRRFGSEPESLRSDHEE